MEDKVKVFLASGKLEEYIYGDLDLKNQEEVMYFINNYPVVKKEYDSLQDQLENISHQQAIKAPIVMKDQIMDAIPDKSTPVVSKNISWAKYISIAAIAASLVLALGWYNNHSELKIEKEKYNLLASACEQRDKQIEDQKQIIAFYNSNQTRKLELQGNQIATGFKAVVYVNEILGRAIITPNIEFKLPDNKCLQLWGDLDGEMIPIAVFSDPRNKEYDLNINPEFTSLNVTIEEKTKDGEGQLHPDVSQLIASVLI